MTKSAPAVVRATQVLDYLAARPVQPLSMTEIAEAIGVNPASTLAILQALTDAGYLERHPRHKTYSIGPALLIGGHAARARFGTAVVADREVVELADHFNALATMAMIIGDDVAIISSSGRSATGVGYPVGSRVRLAAPAGIIFMAWADDSTVRQWLENAGAFVSESRWERVSAMFARVRANGFYVARQSTRVDQFYSLSGGGARRSAEDRREADQRTLDVMVDMMCEPVDLTEPCRIGFLGVPVMSDDGDVAAVLGTLGPSELMDRAAVAEAAIRLSHSADHIRAVTRG
ncbi:IclR family transcriptional regulator [Mycobacteroides chelonae]|jgi:DNA-binding IclR family transcriptional regulator|uniref:IclR family transcriptional regulator n=1 Tax=Mycobacteroides TaxID=670516 RepID=UPI0007DAE0A8|nr:helix-turn-helix domain-containing protein [Mycobacteroides chelonae]PKQ56944.1 IclR family transcriptional regulator [Mycobacterium sp. MHSD3]SKN55946.1 Putative regulatory protein, IclR family [Mycobacteroides abscessus subsp. bolletii]MBF9522584.1 helix-turn-helix domain-containing protein [Mycobacteroides chelonae]MBV0916395.1 helix-turn-helix domain-containing protein [Mycobacteroides chelonae]OHT79776.1 IclR family transcriptional regulator [Mycobacteroides chelonae]